MPTVYLNGRYLDASQARIPAGDPVHESGIGLFEVVRGYGRTPFRLSDHIARLERSARVLGITARLPRLDRVIERLFVRNRLDGGYVRITLTGGGALLVVVRPAVPVPRSWYRRGAVLVIAPWRRDPVAPLVGHKTLNYLELNLARARAAKSHAADTLVLAIDGTVLEGARSNVFAVVKGRLVTPPRDAGLLPGVTRKLVLELAKSCGIPSVRKRIAATTLREADEIFITSTMMEVVPIRRISRWSVPAPGKVTQELMAAYTRRVEEECSR